jgi:hypothetical protein
MCSRAKLRCLAGHIWPASRTLPRPDLEKKMIEMEELNQNRKNHSSLIIPTSYEEKDNIR